jgi:hypothetical protein
MEIKSLKLMKNMKKNQQNLIQVFIILPMFKMKKNVQQMKRNFKQIPPVFFRTKFSLLTYYLLEHLIFFSLVTHLSHTKLYEKHALNRIYLLVIRRQKKSISSYFLLPFPT